MTKYKSGLQRRFDYECHGDEAQGCLCRGAAGVRRCARVVYGVVVEAEAQCGGDRCGVRAGQSVVFRGEGDA